ncbi:hypothetical protein [uncultured Celeribacter sp.]|uniref:hypothetical protein n=1 Tax=uncultured Celeribacter sp. TaxID=1303376 RepID=UPI002AA963F5|nr:hypothetical protein [uncultured Celeribacter sp.]
MLRFASIFNGGTKLANVHCQYLTESNNRQEKYLAAFNQEYFTSRISEICNQRGFDPERDFNEIQEEIEAGTSHD